MLMSCRGKRDGRTFLVVMPTANVVIQFVRKNFEIGSLLTSITTKVPARMHLSTVKMVGDKDMFTMGPSQCVLMEMDIQQSK